ncbi:hypothetical protein C8Q80DRAFT_1117758 [Daedaleopsis nitida]|nr:hypothetical protein C8Q80DRAFT_1117758 [Daedaleopsis nitida]
MTFHLHSGRLLPAPPGSARTRTHPVVMILLSKLPPWMDVIAQIIGQSDTIKELKVNMIQRAVVLNWEQRNGCKTSGGNGGGSANKLSADAPHLVLRPERAFVTLHSRQSELTSDRPTDTFEADPQITDLVTSQDDPHEHQMPKSPDQERGHALFVDVSPALHPPRDPSRGTSPLTSCPDETTLHSPTTAEVDRAKEGSSNRPGQEWMSSGPARGMSAEWLEIARDAYKNEIPEYRIVAEEFPPAPVSFLLLSFALVGCGVILDLVRVL